MPDHDEQHDDVNEYYDDVERDERDERDVRREPHDSANAWICLHRFVHIFLESHLAGPMSSEKRRVWIKYL